MDILRDMDLVNGCIYIRNVSAPPLQVKYALMNWTKKKAGS